MSPRRSPPPGLSGRFAASALPLLAVAACAARPGARPPEPAPFAAAPERARPPDPPAERPRAGRPPVNVRDHGAGASGAHSDAPAINRAIRAAREMGNPFVYVPPGEYVIRREPGQGVLDVPIRPEVDGLTLYGAPDGTSRIVLEADAFAVLVNEGDTSPPGEVRNLVLRDLVFEARAGSGLSDAGIVQINNAPGFRGADLVIRADARAQHARGIKMDGIATSQGTTGALERVVVDGVSKTGIYVAGGTHHLRIEDCETRGMWNAAPVNAPPPGIGVSDAHHITIVNHHAHHNRGDGLLIATNGAPPVRVAAMPQNARGAHGPATGIRVIGGMFSYNGEVGGSGIKVASAYPEVPRDVLLLGVTAQDNMGAGILVEAGNAIEIDGALVRGNGAQGILVRDVVLSGQAAGTSRTSDVRIVSPHIHDNGRRVNVDVGGIEVRGRVERVGLFGGVIEPGDPASRQRIGVSLVEEDGRAWLGFFTRGVQRIAAPIPFEQSAEGAGSTLTRRARSTFEGGE